MPTPMRAATGGLAGGATPHEGASMGTPQGGRRRGPGRESPSRKSAHEEACDKRSTPQDVTSSWNRREGVNLQQEVEPHQTERPPSRLPVQGYFPHPRW